MKVKDGDLIDRTASSRIVKRDEALDVAREYANLSRASSTWRAYESDWRLFTRWCNTVMLSSLPATPDTVRAFVATEAKQGRAASTIQRRLAAIRLMHIAQDLPNPTSATSVTEVLRGIRRSQRARTPNKAEPLLPTDLERILTSLDWETNRGLRDRALLLTGFHGALRPNEIVGIKCSNLDRRDKGIVLDIPWSKADQEGQGELVALRKLPESNLCPVAAIDAWCEKTGITDGALFRKISRFDKPGQGALSTQSVTRIIRDALFNAGYRGDQVEAYSGHSLRRGYVTHQARSGESFHEIMQQTRHKRVETVLGYVEREALLS